MRPANPVKNAVWSGSARSAVSPANDRPRSAERDHDLAELLTTRRVLEGRSRVIELEYAIDLWTQGMGSDELEQVQEGIPAAHEDALDANVLHQDRTQIELW